MAMMQRHTTPLEQNRLVDTRSVDEARDAIGRIFCPHFLGPTGRQTGTFHACHNAVALPGFSVNYVSYGARVDIDPGELARFFLLQIPIRGSAHIRCGTSTTDSAPGSRGSLLSPTLATRMTWSEDCEKIIILIDRRSCSVNSWRWVDAAMSGWNSQPASIWPRRPDAVSRNMSS